MSLNTILATAPLTTSGYHIKANGTTLGNSLIWDNGTNVGIGNTNTSYTLDVSGTGRFTSTLLVSGAATFSSSVNAAQGIFSSDFTQNETSKVGISFASGYGQINSWGANASTYGGLKFQLSASTGGTFNALTLAPSGAATFSSSVTATSLIASSSLDGDPELATFTNSNAGTGTEATIYVRNSSSNNDGTFIQATGTAFTTTGGFVQDGGTLGTGTGLSGGLSLIVRANADMRFYTNGHTNERMRITSGGDVGIGKTPEAISTFRTLDIKGSTGAGIRLSDATNATNLQQTGGDFYINNISSGTIYFYNGNAEKMRIAESGLLSLTRTTYSSINAQGCYDDTSASGANMFINSGGAVLRSTSSLRFKTDVETLDNNISESIYKMRPIWYRSLCGKDRKDWSWYGFGAEELAELEPRLVHWGYKREDYVINEKTNEAELKEGAELIADGVQYERITVLLVAEMQKHNKAIQEQQAIITSLQDRLDKAGL